MSILLPVGSIACVSGLAAFYYIELLIPFRGFPGFGHVISLFVTSVLFLWFASIVAIEIIDFRTGRHIGIAPYFEKPVEEIHTYSEGHALAARCEALDERAIDLGVKPLSDFGFNDDFYYGEELVWWPAESGLETVSALLTQLRSDSQSEEQAVIADLERVKHALTRARDQGNRFCLVITSGFTNMLEHEKRVGKFF